MPTPQQPDNAQAPAVSEREPGAVSMDRIVAYLREAGVQNASVEQTGGGCATIYAGPVSRDAAGDERYALIAGPGWFEGPGFTNAWISFGDFAYGPDDDGDTAPLFITEGDERAIAQTFVAFIQAATPAEPTSFA